MPLYKEVDRISDIQSFWHSFDFSYLLQILSSVIPALICITLHELSHGLAAFALGDDTAKRAGRLTLNPLRHLDPVGMLMMLVFRFGWAKPVPVNMYRFGNPKKGMALTALAGPVSNVIITLVFLVLYGALYVPLGRGRVGGYILEMLEITAYMSLGLAVFNLLPLPPLDGSKVLFALLPEDSYRVLMRYERYGGILLLALSATGVLGRPLSSVIRKLFLAFLPLAQYASDIVVNLFYR